MSTTWAAFDVRSESCTRQPQPPPRIVRGGDGPKDLRVGHAGGGVNRSRIEGRRIGRVTDASHVGDRILRRGCVDGQTCIVGRSTVGSVGRDARIERRIGASVRAGGIGSIDGRGIDGGVARGNVGEETSTVGASSLGRASSNHPASGGSDASEPASTTRGTRDQRRKRRPCTACRRAAGRWDTRRLERRTRRPRGIRRRQGKFWDSSLRTFPSGRYR